ncbi:MAG: GxxExxY protein [Bacteroidetes bacterium]|nr:GxxExxY protein [Bacteroidota bacterium]
MDKGSRGMLAMQIYDAAREVHQTIGAGMLYGVFQACLIHELRLRGLRFRTNALVDVHYKGIRIDERLVADLIVEENVVVEIVKTSENIAYHLTRLNTILSFTGIQLGILLDPSAERIVDGFRKVINPKKLSQ